MKTRIFVLMVCVAFSSILFTGCPAGTGLRDRSAENAVLGRIKKAGFDRAYVAVEGPIGRIAIGFGDVTPDAAAVLVAMAADLARTVPAVEAVKAQAWDNMGDSAPVFELGLAAADCVAFDEGRMSPEQLEQKTGIKAGLDLRENLFAALALYQTTPFSLVLDNATAVIDLSWDDPDFRNIAEKTLAMAAHCAVYLPGVTDVEFRFQSSGGTLSVRLRVQDAKKALKSGLTADEARAAVKVTETDDFFNTLEGEGESPVSDGKAENNSGSSTPVAAEPTPAAQEGFQIAYAEYQRLLKEKGIDDPATQAAFKRYQAAIKDYQEKNPQP